MPENKQVICDQLLKTLQLTRNLHDLASLEYRKGNYTDFVVATFSSGHQKKVDVTCDSGTAMIIDIIRQIL